MNILYHENLLPLKPFITKSCTKGTRTPKTQQADELLGLIPETDEQGEKSKMRKKILVFKEHSHTRLPHKRMVRKIPRSREQ